MGVLHINRNQDYMDIMYTEVGDKSHGIRPNILPDDVQLRDLA